MNKRKKWIDLAKGILIILVVLGHSDINCNHAENINFSYYLYIFHMPAFFILSGYLYHESNMTFSQYVLNRAKRLLIPYICYLLLINFPSVLLLFFIDSNTAFEYTSNLIYGGHLLDNYVVPLWFLTCLFFVQIMFYVVNKYIKKYNFNFIVIAILFVIAHLHSLYSKELYFPWSIDVSCLALTYYSFGFYFKQYIINKSCFICSAVLSIVILILLKFNIVNYGLELWANYYNNIFLDLLIPISISLFLFNLIKIFDNFLLSKYLIKLLTC